MATDYPPAFNHGDFNEPVVPLHVMPPKPVQMARSLLGRITRNAVAQPVVKLRELTATATGTGVASRKSFDRYDIHVVRANSRQKRIHFAPVVETLRFDWQLNGAALVTLLQFEVYQRNNPAPLYTATLGFLGGQCPAQGQFSWDGRLDAGIASPAAGVVLAWQAHHMPANFPGNALSVEHGPYKFKLVIMDPLNNLLREVPARWLYVDVLLGQPNIDWAPANVLVPSPFLPSNALPPVRRDQQVYDALTDGADMDNLAGAVPNPGQTKRVYLQAHAFYRGVDELTGNSAWAEFRALWGEGPNIPLLLEPVVLRSDNQPVVGAAALPALGAVKFAWEWVDKAPPPRGDLYVVLPDQYVTVDDCNAGQAAAQAFLNQAVDFDAGTTTPPGHNCHMERGGKRGPGARAVFPAQAGTAAFPFAVANPAAGNWCAVSSLAAAGAHVGKTGVIFQPSIQPGDVYQLRIAPVCAGLVNPAAAHAVFHQAMDDVPTSLRRDSGNFEVWKTVEHTVYNGDPAGLGAGHCASVAARFAKLNIRVRNTLQPIAAYAAARDDMYNGVSPSAGLLELPIRLALDTPANHTDDAVAVWFKPWATFRADVITHHGTAAAAYLWADGYAMPGGLWEDDRHIAPFAAPWPHVIASFTNAAVNVTQVQITITGGQLGRPVSVSNMAAATPAAVRTTAAGVLRGLAMNQGSFKAGAPPLSVDIIGPAADQLAILNDVALGIADGNDDVLRARYEYALGYAWGFRVLELVFNDLAGQTDGLMTFQFARPNNIGPAPSAKAGFASASRASLNIYMLKTDGMEGTLCHEFGHAMFINHPWYEQPGNDPSQLHADAPANHCTMQTPARQRNFCGLCMLRLRAWSIYKLDAARTPEAVMPVPNPAVPDMHVRTLLRQGANNSR